MRIPSGPRTALQFFSLCVIFSACNEGDPNTGPADDGTSNVSFAPDAIDDSATTLEDTSVVIDILGNDIPHTIDIDPAQVEILAGPSNGSILGVDSGTGAITYLPNADFWGTDALVYRVPNVAGTEEYRFSEPATVTITIISVNDCPTTLDTSGSAEEGETALIFASTIDIDSVVDHTIIVTSQPVDEFGNQLGTVVVVETDGGGGDGPWAMEWTPSDACGEGDDVFGVFTWSYRVEDGVCDGSTNDATATLTTTNVADAPETTADEATTYKNQPITLSTTSNDLPGGGWDTDGDCVDDSWEELSDMDPTTIQVVVQPTMGSLVENFDGTITYMPDINVVGVDSFQYIIADLAGDVSDATTVTITIEDDNTAPNANDDQFTITEDDSDTDFDVLDNDGDIDGDIDPGSVVIQTDPSSGSVTVNSVTGIVTYDVDANFCGVDTFEYWIQDLGGGGFGPSSSGISTVTVIVVSVNDTPVATADSFTAFKNSGDLTDPTDPSVETVIFDLSEGDHPGGPHGSEFDCNDSLVRWQLVENLLTTTVGPVRAQAFFLDEDTGMMTYAPQPNWGDQQAGPNTGDNQGDLFSYRVQDSFGEFSDPVDVNITIFDRNTPPVAGADLSSVDEDGTVLIDVLVNDLDFDRCDINGAGDPFSEFCGDVDPTTVDVDALSANGGTVSVDAVTGEVTYNAPADFNGVDTFTYEVSDVFGLSSADNDSWTSATQGGPPAELEFQLERTVVSVTVNPINDPPTGADTDDLVCEEIGCATTIPGAENVALLDPASVASDIDSTLAFNDTTVVALSPTANGGIVSVAVDGVMTYAPAEGFFGTDSWTWTITDPDGDASDPITATVTVVPNTPPTGTNQSASVGEDPCGSGVDDHQVIIDIDALIASGEINDIDGTLDVSTTTFTVAAHGGVELLGSLLIYTVETDFTGFDFFTFKLDDDDCDSTNPIQVTILSLPNEAPTLDSQAVSVDEGGTVTITLTGSDSDGTLDFSTLDINQPFYGSVTNNGDGTLDYDASDNIACADTDYFGVAAFTLTVDDDDCTTSPLATITVTVNPVNDEPFPAADVFGTPQGTPFMGNIFANDVDLGGVFSLGSDCAGDSGDADSGDDWANIAITIYFDGVLTTADSVDGDVHTFVFDSLTAGTGVLEIDVMNGAFTIWPGTNQVTDPSDPTLPNTDDLSWQCFTGDLNFGYRRFDTGIVGDGSDAIESPLTGVTVTVSSDNECPTAVDDAFDGVKNDFLDMDLIENDIDTDGAIDGGTVVILNDPQHVFSFVNNGDGTFRYRPDLNFIGEDSFEYIVQDDQGAWTARAVVTITVSDRNTPPTAVNDSGSVDTSISNSVVIDVLANDFDVDDDFDPTTDIDPTTVEETVLPNHGVLSIDPVSGEITYTFTGVVSTTDTFKYVVYDGGYLGFPSASSNQATVTIDVIVALAANSGGPQSAGRGEIGVRGASTSGPARGGAIAPGVPIRPVAQGGRPGPIGGPRPPAQWEGGALWFIAPHGPAGDHEALYRMDAHSIEVLVSAQVAGGRILEFAVDPHGGRALLRGDLLVDGEVGLWLVDLRSDTTWQVSGDIWRAGPVLNFSVDQAWQRALFWCGGPDGRRPEFADLSAYTNEANNPQVTR